MSKIPESLRQEIEAHNAACEKSMARVKPGPWSKEPHRVEFKHEGFDCLLARVPHHLAWCGYVAVPKGHPAFGKSYDDVTVDVHGGLTYANECSHVVCHMSDDGVWWLGFDTAHCHDVSPINGGPLYGQQEYRDVAYMTAETKRLAEQLKGMQ